MLECAINEKCTSFDILGDLLESRTILTFRIWPRVEKYFDDLVKTGMKVNLLAGNHDFYGTAVRSNSNLRYVSLNDKVRIIDTVQQDDDGVLWVPWLFDEEKINYNKKTEVVFGHLPINGFHIGINKVEENGIDLDWNGDLPVYLGHFHTPQVQGTIRYLGSIIHSTWNDEGQPKYGYILDNDFNIEATISLNDHFVNLIKVDYDELKELKLPLRSKITVINVPVGDEALVAKALTKEGALSVECLNKNDSLEIEDIDKQTAEGLSVEEAIVDQIDDHDMKEELMAFHQILDK
jgi:DNA repair exonuclease SbcCD nuclease subunit